MFFASVPLISAFVITIVNSAPGPIAQDLAFNPDYTQFTDTVTEDPLHVQHFLPSDESTKLLTLEPTLDPDPIGGEENLLWVDHVESDDNLFAGNSGTDGFCRAEDVSLSPVIGRLRARQDPFSISEGGKSCATSKPDSDEGLTKFLESLPVVNPVVIPLLEKRPDICPAEIYQGRFLPLCSSGNPDDEDVVNGMYLLVKATFCKSYFRPWALPTVRCGSDTSADDTHHNPSRWPMLIVSAPQIEIMVV